MIWYVRDTWNLTALLIKFSLLFFYPLSQFDNLVNTHNTWNCNNLSLTSTSAYTYIQAWLGGNKFYPTSLLTSLLCLLSPLSSLFIVCWFSSPPFFLFSSGILIKGNTKCSALDEFQFHRGLWQTKARWFTAGRPPPPPLFCQRTEETAGGWISVTFCL